MDQDAINQEEWNNPANWSFFRYKSPRDSRIFVPKRYRLGWTINFGNPKGVAVFVGMLALSALIGIIARLSHR